MVASWVGRRASAGGAPAPRRVAAGTAPFEDHHAEVGLEGPCEGGGGGKAVIERDREDAAVAVVPEGAGRPFESKPLDEGEERLAADGSEDPVEVKGRER